MVNCIGALVRRRDGDYRFGGVDFDDPTTYVRGRRALAIAKPAPRGY